MLCGLQYCIRQAPCVLTIRRRSHTERRCHIRDTALKSLLFAAICFLFFCGDLAAETPSALRIGRAGHAFDHLGGIGSQAEAAAASGANIIYSSGVGDLGYQGLPPEKEFATLRKNVSEYNRRAKE